MKEKDIKHESNDGIHWVADLKDSYTVMKNVGTHSESVCHFKRDSDGLSCAIAYSDYRSKRDSQ